MACSLSHSYILWGNDLIICSRMFCQLQDVDFMPAGLIDVHKEGVIAELCKLHMYVRCA